MNINSIRGKKKKTKTKKKKKTKKKNNKTNRLELLAFLDFHQSHVTAIQEIKIDSSIATSELFPETCPYSGGGQGGGGPQPPLPSPLIPASLPLGPRFPPPRPPLPSPWNISPAPSKKKKQKYRSSHHISFHFSAWIIIKALRPEDCRTVCLFLRSFVSLFWSFTT